VTFVLVVSLVSTTPAWGASPNLVAAYSFDEGAGTTVTDASGNSNTGTLVGATWTGSGKINGALSFNGTSSRVDVPNASSLQLTTAMTLEAWVNPTTITSKWRDVIYKGRDNYFLEASSTNAGKPVGAGIIGGVNTKAIGTAALATNTWTHLATTYDGAALRLYVNGTLVRTTPVTGTIATSTNPLQIGGDSIFGQYFAGTIDEVRIYNTALTQTQIQTDMTTAIGTVPGSGPSAPGNLTASAVSSTEVDLAWTASTSDVGVASYLVERCQGTGCAATLANFAQIGTTNAQTLVFHDTGLAANGSYSYRVRARDNGNTSGPYSNVATASTSIFTNEVVVQNLNLVTSMAFLPDGSMLMGQVNGTIRVVQPGATQPDAVPFNAIPNAVAQGDAGLHGFTLDPNFSTNDFYYVFYAHALGAGYRDRVSRFTAASDWNSTLPGSEVVLWEDDVNNTDSHHGASVVFGPDGKLYVSIGDNGQASDSQSLTSYHGKILRINRDGSIPSDNPFVDGPGGNKDEIWAYGLRNPYRFSFDAVTGNLYVGDVGGNDARTAVEEVDLIVRGANYGWPLCEGPCGIAGITNPIYSYPHSGLNAAIMGGFVYRGTQFPSEYRGSYFFADYTQHWIKRLTLNSAGTAVTGVFNFEPLSGALGDPAVGDPIQLQMGPDGALYYLDFSFTERPVQPGTGGGGSFNAGTLRRMRFLGTGNQPPVAVGSATPDHGSPPLDVTFSSGGSFDPDGGTLTYSWDFGDGATSTQPAPVHRYTSIGRYQATLTVSDGTDSAFTSISIVVGDPPTGVIQSPTDGALFKAGDQILISGDGTDAHGNVLPDSAFSWTIVFHHDNHLHPGIGPVNGVRDLTFDIPVSGHDFTGNTRYEVILTVTDGDGLQQTSSVTIWPDKVNLNVDSVPSGLIVTLDGISKTTPFVVDSLKGFQHALGAPDQVQGSTSYAFASWSDLGARTHTITTPEQASSYVATFTAGSLANLAAAYSFDEGAGTTVTDASGNNNTGTLVGATWTGSGKINGALSFNGTSSRVDVPNASSLQLTTAMTLEAWVNPTTITSKWRDVIYKGRDNFYLAASSTNAGKPVGEGLIGGVNTKAIGTAPLATNTWTHLATTYDGAALRLYVNGTLVRTTAVTGTIATSTNPLQIGGDSIFGQYFAGTIDEVRIYNAALTQTQIQTDMTAAIG
jgi:glucose/arabinose dehydrogenase